MSILDIFDRLKDLLSTHEKDMLKAIKQHIELSIKALSLLIEQFEREGEEDKKLYRGEIERLEKRGDLSVSKLTKLIFGGAVMVPLQNYLIKLIDIIDDILDTIHFLSGEDYRKLYFKRLRGEKAREVEEEILNYLKYTSKALEKLNEMVTYAINNEWETLVKLSEEVEKIEEEGDDIKHHMIDEIYRNWDKIREPYFSYLTQFIYMVDQIQDLTEDASNMLLITIQYMHG